MKKTFVIALLLVPSLLFAGIDVESRTEFSCTVNPKGVTPATERFYISDYGSEEATRETSAARSAVLAEQLGKHVTHRCYFTDRYRFSNQPEPEPEPEPDPEPEPNPTPPPTTTECGSPYRGIPDPCAHVGYDIYATYDVDRVVSGNTGSIVGTGTAADPYFVDASNLSRQGRLVVSGSHVIVQGGYVDYPKTDGPALDLYDCSYCTVRDMEVFGDANNFDAGHDSAADFGSDNVVLRLKLHGFGDRRVGAREQDYHGAKIMGRDVWVLDSEIYDLSGDSIQCGDASRGNCQRVYIGGGHMHDNRENGIDIKDSRDVVVSGVRMSGFRPTNSSPGEALIVHDDAFDAKVFDNIISDATIGIVVSGESGHTIEGNTIQALDEGIQLRNTRDLTVRGNTITAPICVNKQSGVSGEVQTGCN